jgi:hypothetical protein
LGGYFCLRAIKYSFDLTFLALDIKLNIVVDISEGFLLGGIVVDSRASLPYAQVLRLAALSSDVHYPGAWEQVGRFFVPCARELASG